MALPVDPVAAAQAQVDAHPELRAALAAAHGVDPRNPRGAQLYAAANAALQQAGIVVPDGYSINFDGRVLPRSWMDKHGWQLGLGLVGGLAGATALAGAAGAGASSGYVAKDVAGVSNAFTPASTGGTIGGMFAKYGAGRGIDAATNIYAQHAQNSATQKATDAQIAASKYASDQLAKSNADALQFQKDQDALNRQQWQKTQDLNAQLEQARLGRLAPYRQTGQNAMAQLLQPIQQRPQPGTIGPLIGR